MNRVVLCGRLESRPTLAYTGDGTAVAQFRLLVPRDPSQPARHPPDPIDCVAYGKEAEQLNFWGESGHRVNLEGRVRHDTYRLKGREYSGARIHTERAYFVDPVTDRPLPGPSRTPRVTASLSANCSAKAPVS